VLIVRAAHNGHDASIEEAAADLGARPAATLRRVTIPILRPAILAGGFLAFSLSLDTTVVSSFLGTSRTITFPALLLAQVRNVVGPQYVVAGFALTVLTLLSVGLVAATLARSSSGTRQAILTEAAGGT
jgi:ABC-type spermidine/putrescine transport system permease subunit II